MRRPWATTRTIKKNTLVRILLRAEMGTQNVLQQEAMANHTAFRVGGPADWVLCANSIEMLVKAVYVARRTKLPYRIIGAGSSILVSDAGIEGIVILNKAKDYELIEYKHGFALVVEAGAMMQPLATELAEHGAAGLEWTMGLSGTVGGAVIRNGRAWEHAIRERLLSIEYIISHEDQIKSVSAKQLGLESRDSNILGIPIDKRPIILNAWFRLDRDDPDLIMERNASYLARAKAEWPKEPNIGAIFYDPMNDTAERLIEAAGLKGHRLGGAGFSEQHTNVIVNYGDATAQDIRTLIELAQEAVNEKFDILLEALVEFIGHWNEEEDEISENLHSDNQEEALNETPLS